jgi:hypothetical protein
MEQCFTLATRLEGEELETVSRKNEQPSLHRTHKVRLRGSNFQKQRAKQMDLPIPVLDLRAFDPFAVQPDPRVKVYPPGIHP